MSKRYYILVGKQTKDDAWEMIFGDYVKSVVQDEKEDTSDYYKLRVVTLMEDNQAAIDAYMATLNGGK